MSAIRGDALLTTANWSSSSWIKAFQSLDPERNFFVNSVDDFSPETIRYALTWKPPEGLIAALPNLEVIFNLGAGVDALLADPTLPDTIPIVRLVDGNLTERMGEWVLLQVLAHHRQMLRYQDQQRRHLWRELDQPIASEVRVGLLGYGVLGRHAASLLVAAGFDVQAWSRTEQHSDVTLYVGAAGLDTFLSETDVVVVLLPLTDTTRGILNADLIAKLPQDGALGGPVLINGGRGGLQNEADILAALHDGRLIGASLDVFQQEPLPTDSPLWDAPNLIITPHCSAVSDPRTVTRYVLDQMAAFERGEPLTNVVDRERGY